VQCNKRVLSYIFCICELIARFFRDYCTFICFLFGPRDRDRWTTLRPPELFTSSSAERGARPWACGLGVVFPVRFTPNHIQADGDFRSTYSCCCFWAKPEALIRASSSRRLESLTRSSVCAPSHAQRQVGIKGCRHILNMCGESCWWVSRRVAPDIFGPFVAPFALFRRVW
jgi:hypothetical protein